MSGNLKEKQEYQQLKDGRIWLCKELYYKKSFNNDFASYPFDQRAIMKNKAGEVLQINVEKFWQEFREKSRFWWMLFLKIRIKGIIKFDEKGIINLGDRT